MERSRPCAGRLPPVSAGPGTWPPAPSPSRSVGDRLPGSSARPGRRGGRAPGDVHLRSLQAGEERQGRRVAAAASRRTGAWPGKSGRARGAARCSRGPRPSPATWSTCRPMTCTRRIWPRWLARSRGRPAPVARARTGRVRQDGHGRVPRRRRGQRAAAEVHPPQLHAGAGPSCGWPSSARASRSTPAGSTSRRPRDAEDEGRHVGRGRGPRRHAGAARAGPLRGGPRPDRRRREHAVGHRAPPRRRAPGDERHHDRGRQHRRRGPPHPRRCALPTRTRARSSPTR